MTYDRGVVSDDFLESSYLVLNWVIFSEIHDGGRSPNSLAKVARNPPSTLSLRMKSLREKGLLVVAVGKHDKRARQFQLMRKRVRELDSIEKAATRFFTRT